MRASVVPFEARFWRISPEELANLVRDAEEHLSALVPQDGAKVTIRWTLTTKSGRQDYPAGDPGEVTSMLRVPQTQDFVSVRLSAGLDNEIRIALTQGGPTITLTSADQKWLRKVEPWARQAMQQHQPRWAWIVSRPGYVAFIAAEFAVGFGVLGLLSWAAAPSPAPVLGSILGQVIVLTSYFVLILRPRVLVGDASAPRLKSFLLQGGLLVAGAILGALGSRLFDVLFPISG